jgi:glucan phosphoethanolaminetransferase (alkaline phosphatase superfamily)
MVNICAPALIYLAFSTTQVILDTFNGFYNTAFLKFIVMIIITIMLNILCESGMGVISWIIVFIPFIFMSVIVTILLYFFGLNPTTGEMTNVKKETKEMEEPRKGGNLLFSV